MTEIKNLVIETKDWILLFISSIIGGFISAFISNHFYKKNLPTENILRSIEKALPDYFLPVIKPEFFGSNAKNFDLYNDYANNLYIPHAVKAIFDKKIILPGQPVKVLIQLRDAGMDLEVPDGVKVFDFTGRQSHVQRVGSGYVEVTFYHPEDIQSENFFITINLTDNANNTNIQKINYPTN